MDDQDFHGAIDAVRAARYALLTKPGARDNLYDAMTRIDSAETRQVLRRMLADDLRAMRRMGMKVPRRSVNA